MRIRQLLSRPRSRWTIVGMALAIWPILYVGSRCPVVMRNATKNFILGELQYLPSRPNGVASEPWFTVKDLEWSGYESSRLWADGEGNWSANTLAFAAIMYKVGDSRSGQLDEQNQVGRVEGRWDFWRKKGEWCVHYDRLISQGGKPMGGKLW